MFDSASSHTPACLELMGLSGVHRLGLPPYSPDLFCIEPVFKNYKRIVRSYMVHHPGLPLRMIHVLSVDFISLSFI